MKKKIPAPPDAVDYILLQWRSERPDLDTRPMATIGRLTRCAALVQRRLDTLFASLEMTFWEFDVLATLRRSGPPYCLTPTALFSTMMVTSGTMTHRLQQLEKKGWISRTPHPEDARSLLVQLTTEGFEKVETALIPHLENEQDMLKSLSADALERVDEGLVNLLRALDSPD
jgi:DNA-binding MarR family transcriptional regulator